MFKTSKELKAFILWAKKEGLKKIKVKDIEFEMGEIALLPKELLSDLSAEPKLDNQPNEDDELLYHSAN